MHKISLFIKRDFGRIATCLQCAYTNVIIAYLSMDVTTIYLLYSDVPLHPFVRKSFFVLDDCCQKSAQVLVSTWFFFDTIVEEGKPSAVI